MTRHARTYNSEAGVALIHMAVFLPMLLLFTGLAVDSGRAYIVKAQLSKAVDGAALSAARNLNGGNPKGEAVKVFSANFPSNFMGATLTTDPATSPDFKANNSDTDANLRITNLPANVDITRGGLLYVAEVFTNHAPLTPLNKFGVTVPPTLRSIAFF